MYTLLHIFETDLTLHCIMNNLLCYAIVSNAFKTFEQIIYTVAYFKCKKMTHSKMTLIQFMTIFYILL